MRNKLIVESLKVNLKKKIRRINDLNRSIKMKEEHGHEQYLIGLHKEESEYLRGQIAELETMIEELEVGE